jgi:hypothetical protein
MNTADNTTDEGVDVVVMLIQLLVRQVSAVVEETATNWPSPQAAMKPLFTGRLRRTAQRKPRCSSS